MGRLLLLILVSTIILGVILTFQIPLTWIGHLPGDFMASWNGRVVAIPLGTAFVFSLLLSALLFLLPKR